MLSCLTRVASHTAHNDSEGIPPLFTVNSGNHTQYSNDGHTVLVFSTSGSISFSGAANKTVNPLRMEKFQATRLAQAIIDKTEAMESISRYPDLTRLGISAGAAVVPGLIIIIRAKCAATGAEEGAVLGLVELTRSTTLLQAIRIPSMPGATRH
jgi:hypothetical protein